SSINQNFSATLTRDISSDALGRYHRFPGSLFSSAAARAANRRDVLRHVRGRPRSNGTCGSASLREEFDRTIFPPYLSHLSYEINAGDHTAGPGNGAMDSAPARTGGPRCDRTEISGRSAPSGAPGEWAYPARRRPGFGENAHRKNDGGLHSNRLSAF